MYPSSNATTSPNLVDLFVLREWLHLIYAYRVIISEKHDSIVSYIISTTDNDDEQASPSMIMATMTIVQPLIWVLPSRGVGALRSRKKRVVTKRERLLFVLLVSNKRCFTRERFSFVTSVNGRKSVEKNQTLSDSVSSSIVSLYVRTRMKWQIN